MTPTWGRVDNAGTWHVDDVTKFDRIKIQNRCITGQITLDDCPRQEADVRRHYRRDRRAG